MNPAVTILIVLALFLTIAGIAFALNSSRPASIRELKAQKKIRDIVAIFQDQKGSLPQRQEALAALASLADPLGLEALVAHLGEKDDPLLPMLLSELPKAGEPVLPFLSKAFRNPAIRPQAALVLEKFGLSSAQWLIPYLSDSNSRLQYDTVQTLDKLGWLPGKDAAGAAYWIARREYLNCVSIGEPAVLPLIEALENPGSTEGAILALGMLGDVRATLPLLKLCKDGSLALLAVRTIARWKEAALPPLLAALSHSEETVRQGAVDALELIEWLPPADESGARFWLMKKRWDIVEKIGKPAVRPLMDALLDKDIQVRLSAVRCLGAIADETSQAMLITLLSDKELNIQLGAVEALGHYQTPDAIQALVQTLGNDDLSPTNLSALASIGAPAIPFLASQLKADSTKVRSRAAEVLRTLKWAPEATSDKALFLLAMQDWEGLVRLGVPAFDPLIQELNRLETCGQAGQALAKLCRPLLSSEPERAHLAIIALIKAVASKPLEAQSALVGALASLAPESVQPILDALEDRRPDSLPLIEALGKIGDVRAAAPLAQYLTTQHTLSEREAAAEALGGIGPPAVNPILEILRSQSVDPRSAGAALGLAGRKARDRLVEALNSKQYDAQVIVYALGKIPDPQAAAAIIGTLRGGQGGHFGQEIKNTAQTALFEIGYQAVQPLIDALALYPADQENFKPILIKMGRMALDQLISNLISSSSSKQREAIIDVLGEIGERKAITALLATMNALPIHRNHVNAALARIQAANLR